MKYIIKESQYRKLLLKEEITKDGFVDIGIEGKVGILTPKGDIGIVPKGTIITELYNSSDWQQKIKKCIDFSTKEQPNVVPWCMKTQSDVDKKYGYDKGLGPTVLSFQLPSGTLVGSLYTNTKYKKGQTPQTDAWTMTRYFDAANREEEFKLELWEDAEAKKLGLEGNEPNNDTYFITQ